MNDPDETISPTSWDDPDATISPTSWNEPQSVGANDSEHPPGSLIGDYRVIGFIAAGGFGAVYRVEHTTTGAPAALKVLHADLASKRETVVRFEREVEAIKRIRHPGVIEIVDFGRLEGGRPYFVMELLAGETLHVRLCDRGRLSVGETLGILEPLCSALSAAHERAIVHRDIKPSNVLLSERDGRARVVLLDFGVAKLLDDLGPALTASRFVVGSLSCMSPEQLRGKPVDARTDVYGLGTLIFRMLTGLPPFNPASPMMVHEMHLHARPPRLSSLVAINPVFDEVVLRAMSKDPAGRQPTVNDVFADFRAAAARARGEGGAGVHGSARRLVALHVEVSADAGAMDSPDDSLLADVETILPFAASTLAEEGFTIALETGNTLLLVKELPDDPGLDKAVRLDAVRAAVALNNRLTNRPDRDERVRINLCIHSGRGMVAGEKLVGGEILDLDAWVPKVSVGGVLGSLQVFADLAIETHPLDDASGVLFVVDSDPTTAVA